MMGDADGLIDLDGISIFTSESSASFSITFACNYDTTASASTDMFIEQQHYSGDVAESDGSFEDGLSLTYYSDFTFGHLSTKPYHVIGEILYVD